MGQFKIDIENYGVGPAFIERRVIIYKNELYDMEFDDFLRENIPAMDSVKFINTTTLQIGLAISANTKRNLITVGGGQKSYLTFLKIMQDLENDGFDYRIQYKSIYEDRWTISAATDIPVPKEED